MEAIKVKRFGNKLEKEILKEISLWLHSKGYFFWRANNVPVFAQNHAGKYVYRTLPKFTPRGIPDVIILHNGIFIGLEVKRPLCKLRPEQEEFGEKVTEHGGCYCVVHSLEEVQSLPVLKYQEPY